MNLPHCAQTQNHAHLIQSIKAPIDQHDLMQQPTGHEIKTAIGLQQQQQEKQNKVTAAFYFMPQMTSEVKDGHDWNIAIKEGKRNWKGRELTNSSEFLSYSYVKIQIQPK